MIQIYCKELQNNGNQDQLSNGTIQNDVLVCISVKHLKGHWTSITSSPTFFQKSWDFDTIRSVGMGKDCMLSFTFQIDLPLKKSAYF